MGWYPYVLQVEKSGPDWTAIIISSGVVIVATLAYLLNRRLRKVPFQQALHMKQLDTSLEMMTKLRNFQDPFFTVIKSAPDTPDLENLSRIRQHIGCLITKLLYEIERFAVVLPDPLMESLGRFAEVVTTLHGSEEGFAKRLAAFRAPDDMSLVAAYRNVTQTARKELGIDPLTDDTLKLIGLG